MNNKLIQISVLRVKNTIMYKARRTNGKNSITKLVRRNNQWCEKTPAGETATVGLKSQIM